MFDWLQLLSDPNARWILLGSMLLGIGGVRAGAFRCLHEAGYAVEEAFFIERHIGSGTEFRKDRLAALWQQFGGDERVGKTWT